MQIGRINPKRFFVMALVAVLYERASAAGPMSDELTLGQWEALLKSGSGLLNVPNFWITPHKLRHGAPSTDILEGVTDTHGAAAQGRWGSEVSTRIYKQPGKLLKIAAQMPAEVRRMAEDLLDRDGAGLKGTMRAALRMFPEPRGGRRPPRETEEFDEDLV